MFRTGTLLVGALLAGCSANTGPSCRDVEAHFVPLVPDGAADQARAVVANHCDRWSRDVRSCVRGLRSLTEGLGTMPCFEALVWQPDFARDLLALNVRLTELARTR